MPRDLEKEKFWTKKISEWRKSGITKSQFCQKNRLPTHTMGYWITKLGRDAEKSNDQPKFVKLVSEKPLKLSASIVTPDGIKIEFTGLDSARSIVDLVSSLSKKLNEKY